MRKSVTPFLVLVLLMSVFLSPGQTAYAQGGITLPAEINKSFDPISIAAGEMSVLSVTIFNPNVFALTNAAWTDNLVGVQPGLRIANPAGVTNTCGGTVTASPGATSFSLSGGTVPAQVGTTAGRCTVSVNVTSNTTGSLINTIPVGALSSTGGGTTISNTSPASATLNVTGTVIPSVTKNFSPGTIWAGGTSRLSIVIRNRLPSTSLTQASLTDNLPTNVFLADPVNPILTGCGASADLTANPGGTFVTLENATIAANSTCTITVSVTSDDQDTYTNTIPANALETEQGLTNPSPATADLIVQEIGVSKRFSATAITPGEIINLIITLQNPLPAPYTGVQVTDNLPTPMTVAGTATTTCGGSVSTTTTSVTLSGGTIPAGSPTSPGSCEITVPVTVPAGAPSGTLRNSIPVGALTTDQGVSNSRPANANVTVHGSELLASKSFSPTSITAGGNSRLRIDITAPGDTDLTNFSITDNLPAGITVSNSSPPSITGCGPTPPLQFNAPNGAATISLTNGLIEAGERCRIDVWVTGDVNGTYTNIIPPTNISNTENRRPSDDLRATLRITSPTALAIELVKGFDPLLVTGGATSTMSVQLINPGNVALTGIGFTDNMPANMILANPVNFNVGTCGGTLSGTPGSSSFTFSGGSLPPLTSCTLTLSATMTVNGNLTNIIPAGAVTTDNGVTNADPVEASLTNLPGASISKSFSPNPIPAGSYSLLTIIIQNTGNIELVEMGMTDNLPVGLEVAGGSTPAPTNSCGGSLTAVSGTRLIQLTNGFLAGNSSCTIVVSITGSNPGDYLNTIPVGGLIADPNTRNNEPTSDTLTITSGPGGGGTTPTPPPPGGGGSAPGVGSFFIPVTGFKAGVTTDMSRAPRETYLALAPDEITLEIPSLGVKVPIVGVPKKNGTWNVSWLGNQAGWLEGSAFPSWSGNSVLTGHVYQFNGRPGPFAKLHTLKYGDQVIVHAYGQKYTFTVQTNAVVEPTDTSVMKHEEKSWLTLVTCSDYDWKTETYLKRFVVRAVLLSVDWE